MRDYCGRKVFEEGDVLYVRFPEKMTETVKVVAVPAVKDSDFCYGCIFRRLCRRYEGNSPFSWSCYTTIFRREEKK